MSVSGLSDLLRNLDRQGARFEQNAHEAGGAIAALVENYARSHHGETPRAAGWVYPGGGRFKTVRNMYHKAAPGMAAHIGRGRYWKATRRWRPAGKGWGDVTGSLNRSTMAMVTSASRRQVVVTLSANTQYAPRLELGMGGKWRWLRPAVSKNKPRILRIVKETMHR